MALYSRDGELKQLIDRDEAEDAFDRLANEARKLVLPQLSVLSNSCQPQFSLK